MTVLKVSFFASLREATGHSDLQVAIDSCTALDAHLQHTLSADGYAALLADNVRLAVDQQLVDESWSQLIAQDKPLVGVQELAFLPPVTGG